VHRQRRSYHGVDGIDGKGLWDRQFKDFNAFYYDYMRTIVAVDESVGRIVDALAKKGQLESTFFMFTSDNGFMLGEHGLLDKRCMYEGSIRIPLVVHCPDLIKPGSAIEEMVLNIDYSSTLLEVAGVTAPPTMQGASFLPLLRGEQIPWRDAFLYEYFFEPSYPMTPSILGVRTPKWKYMEFQGIWDAKENFALYDLEHDSAETMNLADRHETKAIQAELSKELGSLLARFGGRRSPSWKA
jgi:N-acetylglucosamine-6-sulfatase